jgi:chemotaxis signal transduction protein
MKASTIKLISCTSGTEDFCLEMTSVRQIEAGEHLKINEESTGPLGWINYQGSDLPVYALREKIDPGNYSATADHHEGRVLIMDCAEPLAVKVDRVNGIIEASSDKIVPLPLITDPLGQNRYRGIVKLADQWQLYPNHQTFVATTRPPQVYSDEVSINSTQIPIIINSTTPRQGNSFVSIKPQLLMFSSAVPRTVANEDEPIMFALSLTQVKELLAPLPLISVPGAPNYVLGMVNWRDQPVPVIDLKVRLGIKTSLIDPEEMDPRSRLLIARSPHSEQIVGFLINSMVKTFALPIPYEPFTSRPMVDLQLCSGLYDIEGLPLVIPNLEAVLTTRFHLNS